MCTFADVNAEDKLQLALIRIAQLEDELKAQTSRPDWTAREKELNDRHARELYDQKMFFKEMLGNGGTGTCFTNKRSQQ